MLSITWRKILQVVAVALVVLVLILVGPGLGSVRTDLAHARAGWLVAAVALEVLSALSYVVIFRTVFCRRMGWRLSYQIGMAGQAANSLLSASGAGGLALSAWALRRAGMSAERIGRRTVAFFLLTSLANVGAVIAFAGLYAVGVLHHDGNAPLTYGFGAAALVGTVLVLALPRLLAGQPSLGRAGRVGAAVRFVRHSLGDGVRDGVVLLRRRPVGVVGGSVGTMAFDLAVLGASFRAFGHSPALGVLALGYLIGQLGGNLPLPGGIGGIDGGLIATFVLYHQPLAATTAAVLIYHAVSFWVPTLLGTAAFVRLRSTLDRTPRAAAICVSDPIEAVAQPALAA